MEEKFSLYSRKQQILDLLRQRTDWLSGEVLCQQFGISRNAVWKHILQLRLDGYDIRSTRRLGYRYVGFPDSLSQEQFCQIARTKVIGQSFSFCQKVTSTNFWAWQQALEHQAPNGALFVADCQSEGEGRAKSSWFSPPGCNLYASLLIRNPGSCLQAQELCQKAAWAMACSVQKVCDIEEIEIENKGDLCHHSRKFGGVMGQVFGDMDNLDFMIIGIGLLLNMQIEEFPIEWCKKMISLSTLSSKERNRIKLLAFFAEELEKKMY